MGKWGKLSHVLFIYLFLVGALICVFFSLALVFGVLQGVILLVNLRSLVANDFPGISSFKITVRSGVCFVFPHYFPHYFPHSFSPLFFPIIFTIIFPILIFPILQQPRFCAPGPPIFSPSRAPPIRRPIRMSKSDRLRAANGEKYDQKMGKIVVCRWPKMGKNNGENNFPHFPIPRMGKNNGEKVKTGNFSPLLEWGKGMGKKHR